MMDFATLKQILCHCTGQMQDALFTNIIAKHVRQIMSTKLDAINLLHESFSDTF